MAKTEETPQPDKRFEDITTYALEEPQKLPAGLEDAVTHAWSAHVKATPEEQGKGLGEKLYDAGASYIGEKFYGGQEFTNKNAQLLRDKEVMRILGITRAHLADAYKDRKEVHVREIAPIREKMIEGLLGVISENVETQLDLLGDSDFEPFRAYVVELGQKVGLKKVTPELMPRLAAAKDIYKNVVLPAYQAYKKGEKDLQNYDNALEGLAKARGK